MTDWNEAESRHLLIMGALARMDELDTRDIPPSAFVKMGQPCCSCWGKSEIEWLALAYVQALANDGDIWKKLSREQTYNLLSDEQKNVVHGMLTTDYYQHWFDSVSDRLTDADGAFGVGGFWNEHRYKQSNAHSAHEQL